MSSVFQGQRDESIDYAKAVAELVVIVNHISFIFLGHWANNFFLLLFNTLHNPAFFCLSGYLF